MKIFIVVFTTTVDDTPENETVLVAAYTTRKLAEERIMVLLVRGVWGRLSIEEMEVDHEPD